jgi:DNA primase
MIPESFIQEVLNRVDVVDIVDQRVKLKKAGSNFVACCPFHQEKSPSFSVSPSKQFYHCFGCGAHGSAISFLIEYDGLSFIDAIQYLANHLGLKVPNEKIENKEKQSEYKKFEETLMLANTYYKKNLRESKEAINYLKKRGLTGEVAREFQIGFANEDWQGLKKVFPQYESQVLQSIGLVQKNENGKLYDRFRNRIMFPIFNPKGSIIGFGGRVIKNEDMPKYYNSPETPLFKKSYELYGLLNARKAIRDENNILIVEGYMDVIALHQHGIKNVVATLGTATTVFHIQKLIRYSKRITFCFDGDNAGVEAAWKALNNLIEVLDDYLEFYFLFLPQEHDPDSFIREYSKEKFTEEIKNAIPMTEFIVKRLTEKNELNSQEKKIKLLNELEPLIKKINSEKYKLFLIKRISQLIQVSETELINLLKIKKETNVASKIRKVSQTKKTMTIKRKFLLLLIAKPELFNLQDSELFNDHGIEDQILKLIAELKSQQLLNENTKCSALLHLLEDKVDDNLLNELKEQISDLSEKMDLDEEFRMVKASFLDKDLKHKQSIKFSEVKNKKLSQMTEEEREFLKNYRKPSEKN